MLALHCVALLWTTPSSLSFFGLPLYSLSFFGLPLSGFSFFGLPLFSLSFFELLPIQEVPLPVEYLPLSLNLAAELCLFLIANIFPEILEHIVSIPFTSSPLTKAAPHFFQVAFSAEA